MTDNNYVNFKKATAEWKENAYLELQNDVSFVKNSIEKLLTAFLESSTAKVESTYQGLSGL